MSSNKAGFVNDFFFTSDYNLPCTEDVPTCGDTCGKLLDCGIHTCSQRCHTGNCGSVSSLRIHFHESFFSLFMIYSLEKNGICIFFG